jgi:dipeptidyl aminopeptidase/acylaminoacyl peptidase
MEGPTFVQRVDAAVDELHRRGIVDPERVALTGFSRAGYEVYYAATHPGDIHYAAAVCADSFRGSYSSYLVAGAHGHASASDFDALYGGDFWRAEDQWLMNEPTFNVDRVHTPILFTEHGQNSGERSPYALETIGAFALNEKPIEYLYFPTAGHLLRRPRERIAMIDAVVDWVAFWLQDYQDPSPEKAAQYERWRLLKKR